MDQELIRITDTDGIRSVSAKELYQKLGYNKSQWARWCKMNITNNDFAREGTDYHTFDTMSKGNDTKDYALTIEFAKELCMLARSKKGKEIRMYFIKCEDALRKVAETQRAVVVQPKSAVEMFMESAKAMYELDQQMKRQSERTLALEARLDKMDAERENATKNLLTNQYLAKEAPQIKERDIVRKLANEYSAATGVKYNDVWHSMYSDLYYIYHKRIGDRDMIPSDKSKLDAADRLGYTPMLHAIISGMINKLKKMD